MLEKKYNPANVEKKWQRKWLEEKVFEFNPDAPGELFSIDTPPPTLSGSLHIGHVFSYTQAEIIARCKRMQGYNVFYPFGFDDNGLPTERLVEKELGVKAVDLGREEFNALCMQTVAKYHQEFKDLWQALGFSFDWNLAYSTISPRVQRLSQRSFLDLHQKNLVYRQQSPALWCVDCATSIAQAELESAEKETTFNYISFSTQAGELEIATTRPELLGACVAVMVNPEDNRFQDLIGKEVTVPLYNYQVPIIADEAVDMEKGTGVVMVCTFGDQQDMEWWKQYNLPLRQIIQKDGVIIAQDPFLAGLKIGAARKEIIRLLEEAGLLIKQETLNHVVAVHERCGRPVEYINAPQWFVAVKEHKEKILEAGNKVNWHPAHMERRFRDWVENLQWDWCISRQRYFGVPFPLWYCADCGEVVLARDEDLPVNPLHDKPQQACPCGGQEFIPEGDVMDTWATSSITPQINAHWGEEQDFSDRLIPMSMRTQAHEIIRTWAFYTIAKSLYHTGEIPWQDIMICGFVLAKKGEKISKSKGNAANTPMGLVVEHSADVVRWWAASARLGSDISFTQRELDAGRRSITKLWNASKFALMHLKDYQWQPGQVTEPLDQWMLKRLGLVQDKITGLLDKYEVGLARETLERFFWHDFCDNYLEIVKDRLYNPDKRGEAASLSGRSAFYQILLELLKVFAVFAPHVTEEIYRNGLHPDAKQSLHTLTWGGYENPDTELQGEIIFDLLSMVRKFKSTQGLALSAPLKSLTITLPRDVDLTQVQADIAAATKAGGIVFNIGELDIQVEEEQENRGV